MSYAWRIGRAFLSLCDFGYYQRKGICVMSHSESLTKAYPGKACVQKKIQLCSLCHHGMLQQVVQVRNTPKKIRGRSKLVYKYQYCTVQDWDMLAHATRCLSSSSTFRKFQIHIPYQSFSIIWYSDLRFQQFFWFTRCYDEETNKSKSNEFEIYVHWAFLF